MRYQTRQRIKRSVTIAWQRTRYHAKPDALRHRALLDCIDWSMLDGGARNPDRLWEHFSDSKWSSVKYLVDQDDINWYRDEDPFGSHADLMARANAILDHRIPVLGIGDVEFSDRIDWYKDPVSGSRFPSNLFSSRPERGVDGRFRTELNLHRHFPVLALAWRISGDDRYLDELLGQWRHWMELNPPIDDTFINDALELAIRVVTWTHCLHLLHKAKLEHHFYLEVLWTIVEYAKLIEKNYDAAGNGNNHQIAEGFGLFFTGLLYPELNAAERWRRKGMEILEKQTRAQFLHGGAHVEQSASYHVFVLECCQMACLLAKKNGLALDESFLRKVEAATEYLEALTLPNGALLDMGDAAFKFFCPTGDARYHPRTYLDAGMYLFGERYRLHDDWRSNEESFWLLGKEGLGAVEGGRSSEYLDEASITSRDGHVFARAGDGTSEEYLHFDCAPHGLMPRCGHGHEDALSVDYVVKGQSILVDPGTFTYVRRDPLREYFAGARAHNSIILDGTPPARRGRRPFGWTKPVDGELRELGAAGRVVWAVGRHRGYEASEGGALVERSLLAVLGEYLIIVDRIDGNGEKRWESIFHFHPSLEVNLHESAVVADWGKADVKLHWVGSGATQATLHRGDDPVQPGWYSPCYGMRVASTVLRLCSTETLPSWRVVAISQSEPGSGPSITTLEVDPVCLDGGSRDLVALSMEGREGRRDRLLIQWRQETLRHWGVESNARMVLCTERGAKLELYHFGAAVREVRPKDSTSVECISVTPLGELGDRGRTDPAWNDCS